MKVPYQDIDFNNQEQAAGFPPFTRGYFEYSFTPKIILDNEAISFDYTLQKNSPEAIYQLFLLISKGSAQKSTLRLLLDVPADFELVVLTRTLRTLFSLVNHLKSKNAAVSKFHFYIKNKDFQNILITHKYIEMSQIDTLIISQKNQLLLENLPQYPTPVDALYGSIILDKNVELLTSKVWDKIYIYFK